MRVVRVVRVVRVGSGCDYVVARLRLKFGVRVRVRVRVRVGVRVREWGVVGLGLGLGLVKSRVTVGGVKCREEKEILIQTGRHLTKL